MTRINCIPPNELHDKHLLAEYRELPRVFTLAYNAYLRGYKQTVHSYTMGAGHVKFFYDKLGYLAIRHIQLCNEMQKRGMTTNLANCHKEHRNKCIDDAIFAKYWNNWTPSELDKHINRERINIRLAEMGARNADK